MFPLFRCSLFKSPLYKSNFALCRLVENQIVINVVALIGCRSEPKLTLGLSLSESSDKHGLFRLDAATGTRTKILFYLKHSHLLNYQSIRALLYNSQKHCNFKHSLLQDFQRVVRVLLYNAHEGCTMEYFYVQWWLEF